MWSKMLVSGLFDCFYEERQEYSRRNNIEEKIQLWIVQRYQFPFHLKQ